ncbi:MAG: type 2 isopentenyl-diphosphate Delta-isomerase [Chloroflexi bacterium]|nr:type 2 isopentenyl-diphosphate Delta-isomerase [Chloroflexota bacterium]
MATDETTGLTSQRKVEHLDIAASGAIEHTRGAGWDDIWLVHDCLPEVDRDAIDLSVTFLGHRLRAPIVIAGMTGGHPRAFEINRRLAVAAERLGIAMGVGSQRAAVEEPSLLSTYTIARETAPGAFLIANVGASQLITQATRPPYTLEQIRALIQAISADALAIHLNFLQEACQPEGDTRARGAAAAIQRICREVPVPVIAKETGAGMSALAALRLRTLGVRALDVGGLGGSNMAMLEARRAERRGDRLRQRLGETFADWGIPTPVAIIEARTAGLPIIATGGIRSGLDAAKAINLGAALVGIARPVLAQAEISADAVIEWLTGFIEELRVAMFLTGSASLADLRMRPRRISGRTAAWLAPAYPAGP